jgi:hypothetical protein
MRLVVLLSLFAFVACTESETAATRCGVDGVYGENNIGASCAYIVIGGGFDCPEGLSHRMDFSTGVVCSEHPSEPEELPMEVCIELDLTCRSDSDGGGVADASDRELAESELACWSSWESVLTSVTAEARASAGFRPTISYEISDPESVQLVLTELRESTVFGSSSGPFSIETHSLSWAELRDSNDVTLFTLGTELIPESAEVFGPMGHIYECPSSGSIRLNAMPNLEGAADLVLFQEALDGVEGPTIELARFRLPE